MPLFGPVEQKNVSARAVHGSIYVVLVLGSISMAYPFLLMLGASVTTEIDFEDWRIVPAYLTDDAALFRKWLDDRYGAAFFEARRVHGFDASSYKYIESIPNYDPEDAALQRRVGDWLECVDALPEGLVSAFYLDIKRTKPTHQKFAAWMADRYNDDIELLNKKYKSSYARFLDVAPVEYTLTHKSRVDTGGLRAEYLEFRRALPPEDLMPALTTYGFLSYIERHKGGVEGLNALTGSDYGSLDEVLFPAERPTDPGPWRDLWDTYVAKRFPLALVRVEGDFDDEFRVFLQEKYADYDARVRAFNVEHDTDLPPLAETAYSSTMPDSDLYFADWVAFTDRDVPPEAKRLTTVEGEWRKWLRDRYGVDPATVNQAHGTDWHAWPEVRPPCAETDVLVFHRDKGAIRKEFFFRNYRLVIDYMVLHGRAAFNTFVLVSMVVLGHLTVQPLAAYGLSRFNLSYSHRILLFLLATMAFPKEVGHDSELPADQGTGVAEYVLGAGAAGPGKRHGDLLAQGVF